MRLTRSEQQKRIELFTLLSTCSESELRQRNILAGLEGIGSKDDLIRALIATTEVVQEPDLPQALAISTKSKEAKEFVQRANAHILPQSSNGKVYRDRMKVKYFALPNRDGQLYQVKCPYTQVKKETLAMMLDKDWLLPLENQRKLYSELKTDPTAFETYLIRKKSMQGKFFLMLFLCKKKAIVA